MYHAITNTDRTRKDWSKNMVNDKVYCSFNDYSVIYDYQERSFEISTAKTKRCIANAKITKLYYKDTVIDPADYKEAAHSSTSGGITVSYSRDNEIVPSYTLKFYAGFDGIDILFVADPECTVSICGDITWGEKPTEHTFPMSSIENSCHLRSAIGPAASAIDNMLFDRLTDSAVSVNGGKTFRMHYNWDAKAYNFELVTGIKAGERKFRVSYATDVYTNLYKMNYGPINKEGLYKTAPAGWMTWYSVGFDACEANVLENAEWQNKNLKDFGANTIWIDWEWHHADYAGIRTDGTDSLTPDPKKYPHGLAYMAEMIKENGFVPALWIGYTNDPGKNEFIEKNPEIVLSDKTSWCGTYFYDFTHPKYLNEFLPMALNKVMDWGYEAIKYDTIMDGYGVQERCHMQSYDPSITTKESFRNMVKKTRECLGKDCYMLACGPSHSGILGVADVFDAARIGADTFEWNEFIEQGIVPVMKYYPVHNMALYNDPDNVIISEKYNNYRQASSRIYFVAMLGLPMTFGDILPELPPERVDLLKRCLPVMDIHPMDIRNHVTDKRFLSVNLNIEKPYESYNVVSLINLEEEKRSHELRLNGDLYLDDGYYHLYDFSKKQYLGCSDTKIALELEPCETRVIAVRKVLDRPQLISTSRHITQGAAEIENMVWSDENCTLTITANLVANDPYIVRLYIPTGYAPVNPDEFPVISEADGIYAYGLTPEETKAYEIKLAFKKA